MPKNTTRVWPECVYTILHSNNLRKMFQAGRQGSFTEGKKWARAEELLRSARAACQIVPVIFAPGENIGELMYFAELDDVTISQCNDGKWSTTVSVTNLTRIRSPRPNKTQLTVCSTGKKLHKNHIRTYVVVRTPKFVLKAKPR